MSNGIAAISDNIKKLYWSNDLVNNIIKNRNKSSEDIIWFDGSVHTFYKMIWFSHLSDFTPFFEYTQILQTNQNWSLYFRLKTCLIGKCWWVEKSSFIQKYKTTYRSHWTLIYKYILITKKNWQKHVKISKNL